MNLSIMNISSYKQWLRPFLICWNPQNTRNFNTIITPLRLFWSFNLLSIPYIIHPLALIKNDIRYLQCKTIFFKQNLLEMGSISKNICTIQYVKIEYCTYNHTKICNKFERYLHQKILNLSLVLFWVNWNWCYSLNSSQIGLSPLEGEVPVPLFNYDAKFAQNIMYNCSK